MKVQSDNKDTQRDNLALRAADVVTQGLNILGSLLILALMILVGADVIGRELFNSPVKGVPEIVTLSIVAIVFLQIPQALKQGRMTRSEAMDPLIKHWSPTLAKALRTLFDLLGVIVVAVIVWTTWPIFTRAWDRSEYIGAVGEFTAPTWPVKLTVVIGGTVLILQFLIAIFKRHAGNK